MSYEGYRQQICTNGHLSTGDDSMYAKEEGCPCGSQIAWYNSVDETNCDSFGMILPEVLDRCFLLKPEVRQTCNLGHSHITQAAVYLIPNSLETDDLRTLRNWDEDKYLTSPIAQPEDYQQTIQHLEGRLKIEKLKLTS